jgi:hypothetical protein
VEEAAARGGREGGVASGGQGAVAAEAETKPAM